MCRISFTTTTPGTPITFQQGQFVSAIDLTQLSEPCTAVTGGFMVKFPPTGTVQCIFHKKFDSFTPESPSGIGSVTYPSVVHYSTPLEFVPDLLSSCANPIESSECVGTIYIPGAVGNFVLDTTNNVISMSCNDNVIFATIGLKDSNALVPVYRYSFTVRNRIEEYNSCRATFQKSGIIYTPHLFFLKQENTIYSSNDIILDNVFITLDPNCAQKNFGLCTLIYETPRLPEGETFQVRVSSTLNPYLPPELVEAHETHSIYRQEFLKDITPHLLDQNKGPGGEISWPEDPMATIHFSGRYFNGREYYIDLSKVDFSIPVEIKFDAGVCSMAFAPICRFKVLINFAGPGSSFRFDRLPFANTPSRWQCNTNYVKVYQQEDHIEIRVRSLQGTDNEIVDPSKLVYIPLAVATGYSNSTIECWSGLTLGYKTDYDVLDVNEFTHFDSFKLLTDSLWSPMNIKYPFEPYLNLTSHVRFTRLPGIFKYDTNCADSTVPWCSILLVITQATLPSVAAKIAALRSFTTTVVGIDYPTNLEDPSEFLYSTVTGSVWIGNSPSVHFPRTTDNPTDHTVIESEILMNWADAESLETETRVFSYYEDMENGVILVNTTYRMLPMHTDPTEESNRVFITEYGWVPINPIESVIDPSLLSYIPPLYVSPSETCNEANPSFCTLNLKRSDDWIGVDIESFHFRISSQSVYEPTHGWRNKDISCVPDNDNVGDYGLAKPLIGFTCTTSSSFAQDVDNFDLVLSKRLSHVPNKFTKFQITRINDVTYPDHQATFDVTYTGDVKPTYDSRCSQNHDFRCYVYYHIYTDNVAPDSNILSFDIPYDLSTFTDLRLANCTGLAFADGTEVTAEESEKMFTLSINESKRTAFKTIPITASSEFYGRWSNDKPLKIIDTKYLCTIASIKALVTGRQHSPTVANIINDVDIDSYVSQPWEMFPEISYPSVVIRYFPVAFQALEDCRTPSISLFVCTTQIVLYGSPQEPFYSYTGFLPYEVVSQNSVLLMITDPVAMIEGYYAGGEDFLNSGLPYSRINMVFEDNNPLGQIIGVHTVLNLYTELGAKGVLVGTYTVITSFLDGSVRFICELFPAYRTTTQRVYFVQAYPITDVMIASNNLLDTLLISPAMLLPLDLNGFESDDDGLITYLPELTVGTMLLVHSPVLMARVQQEQVQVRFTVIMPNTHRIVIDSVLADKQLDCYQTDIDSLVSNPTIDNSIVNARLVPNYQAGITVLQPVDPTLPRFTCTVTLTYNARFPTKVNDIKHEVFFANAPETAYFYRVSYPTYAPSSGLQDAENTDPDYIDDKSNNSNLDDLNHTTSITTLFAIVFGIIATVF